MSIINLSICVSDIPKTKINKSDKNGKSYLNITVSAKKEPDKFGNTHTVYISQSKDEKGDKTYIGSGKEYVFKGSEQTTQNTNPEKDHNSSQSNNLPW